MNETNRPRFHPLSMALVVVGGAVALFALLADFLPIGASDGQFGLRQLSGALVGGVAFLLGLAALIWRLDWGQLVRKVDKRALMLFGVSLGGAIGGSCACHRQ